MHFCAFLGEGGRVKIVKLAQFGLNSNQPRTKEMKSVCSKSEKVTGMRVVVQERVGISNKSIAKSEPLRNKECGREECFVCSSEGGKC